MRLNSITSQRYSLELLERQLRRGSRAMEDSPGLHRCHPG